MIRESDYQTVPGRDAAHRTATTLQIEAVAATTQGGASRMELPPTKAGFESPSLIKSEAGPAFEMKFLVDETIAKMVAGWANERMMLDPHGDPALGGAYRTTSLYSDTPELDVYRRSDMYRKRKYRVRRYGDLAWVFLERKSKWGNRVAKWRVAVPAAELDQMLHPAADDAWSGAWFHQRVKARRLEPACSIGYERVAFAGSCSEGPLRLTMDRHLRGVPTDGWRVDPVGDGIELLPGRVILELKYRMALPGPFKELIASLQLTPSAVSKYRLYREAVAPPEAGNA